MPTDNASLHHAQQQHLHTSPLLRGGMLLQGGTGRRSVYCPCRNSRQRNHGAALRAIAQAHLLVKHYTENAGKKFKKERGWGFGPLGVCCCCFPRPATGTAQQRGAKLSFNAQSHTEALFSHYAHSFVSTAPRTAVSASSQMEHFRQACDAQRQRPLSQLQQANYGSCVFAVRYWPSLVSAIASRHFCSMLLVQHALAHP